MTRPWSDVPPDLETPRRAWERRCLYPTRSGRILTAWQYFFLEAVLSVFYPTPTGPPRALALGASTQVSTLSIHLIPARI